MKFDDADLTISENLTKASDALEQNFIYQFIGAALYYVYYSQNSLEPIDLLGIKVTPEVLRLFFPMGMIYLMVKMSIYLMAYIEWAEVFFDKITRAQDVLFSLRPRSIFLAIPFTRTKYRHSPKSQVFCYIGSAMIFLFPGVIMSMILMSFRRYENEWITGVLLTVTIVVFIGLFLQFFFNPKTKHYWHLLASSYLSCAVIFFV